VWATELTARAVESEETLAPSWDRLCEEHLDFVYRAARRLAGPDAEVDDLVQEVFLVAHRRLADFEGRAQMTTWLYGIAVRVVAKDRRLAWLKALRRRLSLDDAAHVPAPDDTAAATHRREAERTVYGALDGMSEKRRTVLILYELEGLSGDEIAKTLGIPLKTVWTRLHYARRDFRDRVARQLGPGEEAA